MSLPDSHDLQRFPRENTRGGPPSLRGAPTGSTRLSFLETPRHSLVSSTVHPSRVFSDSAPPQPWQSRVQAVWVSHLHILRHNFKKKNTVYICKMWKIYPQGAKVRMRKEIIAKDIFFMQHARQNPKIWHKLSWNDQQICVILFFFLFLTGYCDCLFLWQQCYNISCKESERSLHRKYSRGWSEFVSNYW